jgi:glycosyltransferase involved in cell wall biosynthesis
MLQEAVESAHNQTVPVDVTIIDDNAQHGPAWARNRGLEQVNTRYVSFLDADDLWVNNKTERQLERMNVTRAGLCVEGTPMSTDQFIEGLISGKLESLTSSILVDTEKVNVRFDETVDRREDHLFMIQAAEQAGVCFCPELIEVRKHSDGLSAQNTRELRERTTEQFAERLQSETETGCRYLDVLYAEFHHRRGRAAHRAGDYSAAEHAFITSLQQRVRVKTLGALGLSIYADIRTNWLRI